MSLPTPYYSEDGIVIYCADCRTILPQLPKVDLVLTDPPYPNNAGHFNSGIKAATMFMAAYRCDHWMIFWDELTKPPLNLPLVAKHVWHRNNSNRPDNYEPIYEFHINGMKRASRCFPYPVIYPGLTGCKEATGHPTQKNLKLIQRLIEMADAQTILDPFMGSGTTLRAAKDLGHRAIGIEIEEKYCRIAVERLRQQVLITA